MAEAIAGILFVLAFLCFCAWSYERVMHRDAEARIAEALLARTEADAQARAAREKLAGAEEDSASMHDEQQRLRRALADSQTTAREANERAREAEKARLESHAAVTRALGRVEAADDREKAWRGHLDALTTQISQREANLRNDVEAERVLAAKSLDSLTQLATQLVAITTEMAGLQRIGFRPPMKEAATPKDSAVVGMPSIDDVDRELMEADEKLVARYD